MKRRALIIGSAAALVGCRDYGMRRSYISYQFSVQPPTVPTGLVATAVSTSEIDLTWNASTDPGGPGLKDYGVYRVGTGLLGFVTGTSFNDTGLTSSTSYTYQVTARDTQLLESAKSATASATTQSSSGLTHGQPFTVTGSGFGTKSRALAPIVRDIGAAATGTVDQQWNGIGNVPSTAGGIYNIQNQDVGFQPSSYTIGAPHPYVSRILAGCHLNNNDSTGGNGVNVSVTFTPPAYPYCVRWSWWWRLDPGCYFDPTGDGNFKDLNWNDSNAPFPLNGSFFYTGIGELNIARTISGITNAANAVVTITGAGNPNPYGVGDQIYFVNVGGMTQINGLYGNVLAIGGVFNAWTVTTDINSSGFSAYTSGGQAWKPQKNTHPVTGQCTTDAGVEGTPPMFESPDANGHSTAFWNSMLFPWNPNTGWIKREVEMCVTNTTGLAAGGYFRVYDNSVLVMNYAGKTDNLDSPTTRNVCMGNYMRARGPLNFRYYADALVDVSATGVKGRCAAVHVGNANTWATSTIREPQIPTAWTDGSIAFNFWKGKLAGGTMGFIYVLTESGAVVPAGSATIN